LIKIFSHVDRTHWPDLSQIHEKQAENEEFDFGTAVVNGVAAVFVFTALEPFPLT